MDDIKMITPDRELADKLDYMLCKRNRNIRGYV